MDTIVCQHCSRYNIVHHIKNWSAFPELRYEVKNGITLCQFHHPKKRVDEERLIPILQKLVESNEQQFVSDKKFI